MSINPPNSLAYIGEVAVPYINRDFDPLPANNKFQVPTIWVNTSTSKAWILVNLALGVATWLPIGGGTGTLTTITIPGSVVITPTAGNVNFLDGTNITITGSGDSITFTAAGGTSGIVTIDGDTGSITGATVSLLGNTSAANCGSTVTFTSSSATELDLNVTDANNNTLIGATAGAAITGTCVNNTGLGQNVLPNLTTGGNNISLGCSSGVSYTTSEDSNILIGNAGVVGESNVIRIGTQGTGSGLQNECFIAGIATVATSNSEFVTVDTTTGQLGSTLVVPGAGISTVVRQVFATSGTYTPTAGMMYCDIEVVGGGGAGGGATSTTSSQYSSGSGGGAGEYAFGLYDAASIGSSKIVTIGAGGSGVSGTTGGVGGTTSVGSLISAFGGNGGLSTGSYNSSTGQLGVAGVLGGTGGSGGIFRTPGNASIWTTSSQVLDCGNGANSQFGSGGLTTTFNTIGGSGLGYGSGGAASANTISQTAHAGGNGADGITIITEYI